MSALRVLHLVSTLETRGAERQVLDLVPRLARLGIDARALAVYESLGRRTRHAYDFMPKLVRTIRKMSPDVVHTHTRVGKYWGRLAARIAGTRAIVHTEHDPCDPRRSLPERVLDRAYGRFTDRTVLFFPDQGEFLARLEAIPAEKIVAIPSGLDVAAFDAGLRRDEMRRAQSIGPDRLAVMMIGRLERQKNHELALRAIASLSPKLRDRISLYVIGSGSREHALRRLSCEVGIGASTRFLGYRSDAKDLLNAADLFLSTSRFEGMPTALVEAMLSGVPVVTTPWLGAGNLLEGGALGFIAAGWEPGQVADTLERALGDADGLGRRAAAARARARADYTVGQTVASHVRLYETVAGCTPS